MAIRTLYAIYRDRLYENWNPLVIILGFFIAGGVLIGTIWAYTRSRKHSDSQFFIRAATVIFFFLTGVILYWLTRNLKYFVATAVVAVAVEGIQIFFRRYLQTVREQVIRETKVTQLTNLQEADFEEIDHGLKIREEKAQVDFETNLKAAFLIDSFKLDGVSFFAQSAWELQPGVNILLGRNGYGKSLLLRSFAALLQRNQEASQDLFKSASRSATLEIALQRDGQPANIRRNRDRFTESIGKIPIMAIPDSRFVNRTNTELEAPKGDQFDLRADGAKHFLENRHYGEMMTLLFNELCFDYLEHRSFKQPVFKLLTDTIEALTGDRFLFDKVERVGRNSFRLMVLTEGNEQSLPIQYASQGTLSVLGVVGIIRSYLTALFPQVDDAELLKQPAIVIIDELDAHLHPLWQQKLAGILRSNFPNVQFILSAHSPLVVAGCWNKEVTVLRKGEHGFLLEQLDRDFVGTPVTEIYDVIFGVEDFDPSYLQSASRATSGFSNQSRISELEHKGNDLTELERRELDRLMREEAMIMRAAEIGTERRDDQDRIMQLEAQVAALTSQIEKAEAAS